MPIELTGFDAEGSVNTGPAAADACDAVATSNAKPRIAATQRRDFADFDPVNPSSFLMPFRVT
ncbi:unannotated protein [freshwater metagenome]|uniref:Unannotated protein n=1 Tax=freshwater metagenome TaxID=449393 RepID=A0A6J6CXL3_9ZZZZ